MKNVFILSIDALQTGDLPALSALPNFSGELARAAVVKNVREVYPTLTNVNHASIITGVTPDRHGIYHNMIPFVPQPKLNWNVIGQNWFWKSEYMEAQTLVDAAKAEGIATACVSWPCMGGQIPDYNLAEMWPDTLPTLRETYEVSCTTNVMDRYFESHIAPFDFRNLSNADSFTVPIAADLIQTVKPGLMLEHVILLDYYRHKLGNNHPKVQEALEKIDGYFGQILRAFRDAGTYGDTDFFIVGDHGQMDIREIFHLNAALKERGLLTADEDGRITDYDAYCFSSGFSAQIVLKNPDDPALLKKVGRALEEIRAEYPRYVERVYTAEEAQAEEGLAGPFSFVVEAAEGVLIENACGSPVAMSSQDARYTGYKANHGYHPSKGPKTVMIAYGPDIREGAVVEGASILDECPTFAEALGLSMPGVMGKALPIFKSRG
jgi:predicted AlkP superfamily pyrophosphatase or phosphodiesterase